MLDIAKICTTSLMQMDSKLVVRVDATIDVENTGDEKLEEVTVSDSKVSTLDCGPTSNGDPFENGTGTLDPGETVQCTGSYLPSEADDTKTMGGDPTGGRGLAQWRDGGYAAGRHRQLSAVSVARR
jgi:hypothetical protein